MTLTSRIFSGLPGVMMPLVAICFLSIVAYSQVPNPNSIITFNPASPSVGPGELVQVTATIMNPALAPAAAVPAAPVVNTKFRWKLADSAHSAHIQIIPVNNVLNVVGLNSQAGTPRPASVPVIATYADASLAPPVDLSGVVNIVLKAPSTPSVTATWDVLPSSVCKHSFGKSVGNDYHCIEVTIANHSGHDLQIADVSFNLAAGETVSSTGYNVVRNTLRNRNMFYPRAITLNAITALGPLLTGFTPFFHNLNRRGNFTEGINILSNPLEKGLEKAWPDPTSRHLDNFDGIVLREGVILPNNALPLKTRVFYPKKSLRLPEGQSKDDPTDVRTALGTLILEGIPVTYSNAIRVTSP